MKGDPFSVHILPNSSAIMIPNNSIIWIDTQLKQPIGIGPNPLKFNIDHQKLNILYVTLENVLYSAFSMAMDYMVTCVFSYMQCHWESTTYMQPTSVTCI